MTIKKAATICTGGGLADIGIQQAGFELAWGIEIESDISQVAQANFGHKIIAADILTVDPSTLEPVEAFHVSPPCPNFSVAKANNGETAHDRALARQIARFVEVIRPKIFTLENVWAYHRSESWGIIRDALYRAGYWLDMAHVNAADYGVPQTRKRMIVRALLGQMVPYLPPVGQWLGWYQAIEDLIPGLPESELADWQKARLPDDLCNVLVAQGGYDGDITRRLIEDPAFTITANSNQTGVKAVLVNKSADKYGDGTRDGESPAFAVVANSSGRYRALLIGGGNTNMANPTSQPRSGDRPSFSVTATGATPRVLLFTGQYAQSNETENRTAQRRSGVEPSFTVTASNWGDWRAVIEARTISMTPRALARFQTLPDWYQLPESKTLACKIIGNGVPCELMRRIYEGLR